MKATHRGALGRGGQVAAQMGPQPPPVALKKKMAKKKTVPRNLGALRAFGR